MCMCLCVYVTIVRTGRISAKIKNVNNDVCIFEHLPSNSVTAKIGLREIDIVFEGHKF